NDKLKEFKFDLEVLYRYQKYTLSDKEEALLNAAISLKPKKIIIKRPLKGPFLAGVKPSYSLKGKAIRVDVIVNA
ncbi:MAG: class I SAM-dependent methyltransferase, partial [Lachnospiraceae bacterium]|nr:class I SAM-dependent methyltransferase [Lachnospiraceae bacterium]